MTNLIELRITDRRPFADGHAFGETGAYERSHLSQDALRTDCRMRMPAALWHNLVCAT